MTLEMRNIYKSFGANDVLRNIDFSLQGGEICALLGENGAGKSTLMNILGGILPADSGTVSLDGKQVSFHAPADSLKAGIAFIHQELNLVNDLAVFENMFIGRELKGKGGFLDAKAMCQRCQEVFQRMDVDLDPRTMVRDLDASYKQIVEIARALLMEASIIIMDEPTTSLTEPEIQRVFDMMRTVQSQGVAIIFISHKLKEVMEICTRYTVLRDGVMVAQGAVKDTNVDELARFMVGHDVRTESLRQERQLGEEVLRVEDLSQPGRFSGISFSVKAGEVLGFTGLLGDGRSELFQAIFGSGGKYAGHVFLQGEAVHIRNTQQAKALGIGYVPPGPEGKRHHQRYEYPGKRLYRHLPPKRQVRVDLLGQGQGVLPAAGGGLEDQNGRRAPFDRQPLWRQPAEGGFGQVAQRGAQSPHL